MEKEKEKLFPSYDWTVDFFKLTDNGKFPARMCRASAFSSWPVSKLSFSTWVSCGRIKLMTSLWRIRSLFWCRLTSEVVRIFSANNLGWYPPTQSIILSTTHGISVYIVNSLQDSNLRLRFPVVYGLHIQYGKSLVRRGLAPWPRRPTDDIYKSIDCQFEFWSELISC